MVRLYVGESNWIEELTTLVLADVLTWFTLDEVVQIVYDVVQLLADDCLELCLDLGTEVVESVQ